MSGAVIVDIQGRKGKILEAHLKCSLDRSYEGVRNSGRRFIVSLRGNL